MKILGTFFLSDCQGAIVQAWFYIDNVYESVVYGIQAHSLDLQLLSSQNLFIILL